MTSIGDSEFVSIQSFPETAPIGESLHVPR